jgi:hypothetical protein
LDGIEEDWQPK